MIIKVERTRTGFRFTMPDGSRGTLHYRNSGEQGWWDRRYAAQVKDVVKAVYAPFTSRKKIRFHHCN